eukprot:CAMPEP_0184648392 /NCGR_PEP_ID=MMETSP0308-20130426/5509_1 /TAXON_ID=38269 /ORGANISM="Gloeochaete witrockiana, Strain SAG 46.84" /LENGTH=337 /DNA_ID=CAMNT_0027080183 /DNA_START=248 /DNA_END=1261 /DNA_ORIENTATION=+
MEETLQEILREMRSVKTTLSTLETEQGRIVEAQIRPQVAVICGQEYSKPILIKSLDRITWHMTTTLSENAEGEEGRSKSLDTYKKRLQSLMLNDSGDLIRRYLLALADDLPDHVSFKSALQAWSTSLSISSEEDAKNALAVIGPYLGKIDSASKQDTLEDKDRAVLSTLKHRMEAFKFTFSKLSEDLFSHDAFLSCYSIGLPAFSFYALAELAVQSGATLSDVLQYCGYDKVCNIGEIEVDLRGSVSLLPEKGGKHVLILEVGEIKRSLSQVARSKKQLRYRLVVLKCFLGVILDLNDVEFILTGRIFTLGNPGTSQDASAAIEDELVRISWHVQCL